jgi:endonuclease YncB( thermonuclease family)
MLTLRSSFILVVWLFAQPALAVTLSGTARVVDGDTLVIGGEHVRLSGIDAPELDQTCRRDGQNWACGDWARADLKQRLNGRTVACDGVDRDRYGRLLAICNLDGADIGRTLVRDGVAFAYRRYSADYIPEERIAASERRGLWAGTAQAPEIFRHSGNETAPSAPRCAIKGNISASGRIFHRPGQREYDETRIDTTRGERWFCSVAEAEDAGWRAARR